ncbi:uncharacterized protein [Hyperolius riggenbachi]|uniref:uncharacterized protein n=1 Tax=Hyperolius riggenbachi TaxID=752182 RepID=UPI0035A2B326
MQRSVYDIEELVAQIQAHPCLYDKGHKDYKDIHMARRLWEEIASSFFSNWNEMTPKQQNLKIEEVKMKWRSLKDTFKKELEKQKKMERSGAGAHFKPKYRHYDLLTFLIPCFEARSTEDSLPLTPQTINVDDDVDDTQMSINSSGDASDLNIMTNSDEQAANTRRSLKSTSSSESVTAAKKTKVTSSRKVVQAEKDVGDNAPFQGLLEYLKDNKDKQMQYIEREESDSYVIVKSAIPHLKKIDSEFFPEFHADLINLCRKYVTKTQTKQQRALGNDGNRYGQMQQKLYRPPAQPYRTNQSNTNPQTQSVNSMGANTLPNPTYHTLQPAQRSDYMQSEPSFTQSLFSLDDKDE